MTGQLVQVPGCLLDRGRGAACFAQDATYRQLRDEFSELNTVEPVSRDHLPGIVRQRHLETIFCQIDAEGPTPLIRMPSICPLGFRHFQLGTSMPKKQEESFSSFLVPA